MALHPSLDITIVGAGPAGLAAAAALAQDGHAVTVLERHAMLQTRGGNFIVQASAVQCLASIGLHDALRNISFETSIHKFWSYNEDRPFAESLATPDHAQRRCTERPALQRVCYEAATRLGASVLFNKNVVALRLEDNHPCVLTGDGEEYHADLVVGADGIKSVIRKLIIPSEDTRAIVTPECIFQTEVSRHEVEKDPLACAMAAPTHHLIFGPGRYCIGRPTTHGTMRMLFCDFQYGAPESENDIDGTWNSDGSPTEVRKIFGDFSNVLQAYINCVERGGFPIDKWRIATAPLMKTWIGLDSCGLIIGDAAHAMVPHNAQGISQGIEDGFALSTALRWARSKNDVPRLLQLWEALRKPRAEKMRDCSNKRVTMFSLPDGPEQKERDKKLRTQGMIGNPVDWNEIEADDNAPYDSPQFAKWQHCYDVIEMTNKFISETNKS